MSAATMSNQNLVLPTEGYDGFVDFLYNVPSQPELIEIGKKRKKRSSPAASPAKSSSKPAVEDEWNTNYQALKSFHAKNGNCSVPFGKETGSLRSWTERQRLQYKSSKLAPSQVDDLKALDFDFAVRKSYQSLNPNVSSSRSLDRSSHSVAKQTAAGPKSPSKQDSKKQKTKPESPTAAAKPAPMVRKPSVLVIDDEATWNKQYAGLKAYHAENGNCEVPFGKDTGALRSWLLRQKKVHANSKLEQERVEKLTELGFSF